MADDYYRFVERTHELRGEAKGRVYRLGDRVKVQVIRVDLERRQIDLGLSEILDTVRRSERGRASRPAGAKKKGKGSPAERRRQASRPGRRERAFSKATRRRK